jgi:hypothetical protein
MAPSVGIDDALRCGDGVGIIVGAILASLLGLKGLAEVVLEYILGFAFGWTIFQALFMRDMVGGSYPRALKGTFISEFLSMNLLMTGMVPTVMALKSEIPAAADPTLPSFWFVMSMGLLVGFIVAYPMNWWLVANHLKHGMMTVRPAAPAVGGHDHGAHAGATGSSDAVSPMSMSGAAAPRPPVPVMVAAVVRSTCGRRGHRFPIAANIIPASADSALADRPRRARRVGPLQSGSMPIRCICGHELARDRW